MIFRPLNEIVDDLPKAMAWFESIGISTKETRLQAIHSYLFSQMHFPYPAGVISEADHHSVINDAAGFGLIAQEFAKLPLSGLPKRALRESLYGPLCSSSEDTQSNDSRNKFFELELAVHFAMAGVKIVGFDDVQVEFEGSRYIIECKRPFLDHNFETNLSKAYAQLEKRLKHSTDRGLAAFALEKMLVIDDTIQGIDSTSGARAFAESIGDQLRPRIIANGTTSDLRIVGLLFIFRFLMRTKTAGTNAANYQVAAMPFNYQGRDPISERSRLLRLIDTLQEKFQAMDTGFR
jgi:hypothetical protein